MDKQYKYTTSFSDILIASGEIDSPEINISQASLEKLRGMIPDEIDLDRNIDLLGVAFNAALVNQFNRNGDGINSESAVKVLEYFKHKPTNIEHNKENVVGHIVSASFSNLESNEIMGVSEARGKEEPFNISLGAVLYRSVNKEFTDLVENSVDPESSFYHKVSASWEIGFNDFVIAMGSNKLSEAKIITNEDEIDELKQFLKAFGGNGRTEEGEEIYRLITGEIFPLGIGFTANPAADVKGLIAKMDEDSIVFEEDQNEKNENIISQIEKNTVIKSKHTVMDNNEILNNLVSALEEKVSNKKFSEEAVATVSKIINDAILQRNEKFLEEKEQLEIQKEELAKAAESSSQELEDIRSKLNDSVEKVQSLELKQAEQEALATFDSRMSHIEESYELDNDARKVIAHEIKSLDGAKESFDAYQEKLAVVFKHQSKSFIKDQQEAFDGKLAEAVEKRISELGNKAEGEIIEEAMEQVEAAEDETISNNNGESSQEEKSLRDQFRSAFSRENLTIKY
jgi:hypothetical protein